MFINTPMRRTPLGSCARAASGHVAAAPPINKMNSRRLIVAPEAQTRNGSNPRRYSGRGDFMKVDVRFGSLADMCSAKRYVRFGPIADSCGAANRVR
jgi:hypothetical protein